MSWHLFPVVKGNPIFEEPTGTISYIFMFKAGFQKRPSLSWMRFLRLFLRCLRRSEHNISPQNAVDADNRNMHLKSSLKKPFTDGSVLGIQAVDSNDSLRELPSGFTKRSKVQWTDTNGNELVKIKEYEPSDDDSSDDGFGYHGGRCQCIIQ
ncbi:hypothetical protein OPV22_025720 [Ensete ventricosum]|uniref:Uncharacterized protein n=1 Tax=Ensete ventricosum TaxID=4639 RepID=A0AAV8QI71_ENSVE|nr:hypothetical protein OPV22_025720 [Ensete ventricosum]